MSHRTVVYAFKRPDDVWCAELKNLDTDETVKIQHAATRDEAVRGLFPLVEKEEIIFPKEQMMSVERIKEVYDIQVKNDPANVITSLFLFAGFSVTALLVAGTLIFLAIYSAVG